MGKIRIVLLWVGIALCAVAAVVCVAWSLAGRLSVWGWLAAFGLVLAGAWLVLFWRSQKKNEEKDYRVLPLIPFVALLMVSGIFIALVVFALIAALLFPAGGVPGALTSGDIRNITQAVTFALGILLGGGAAALQYRKHKDRERQTEIELSKQRVSEAQSFSDRMTKAIEHLGSSSLAIRKGGIYELKQLAVDSKRDRKNVVEILSSFFLESLSGNESEEASEETGQENRTLEDVPPDGVIALRTLNFIYEKHNEEYMSSHSGEDLGAEFQDAQLANRNLRGRTFRGANLVDANLQGANLRDAYLRDAHLRGAHLRDANLERANLRDANLERANLRDANLERANLERANLERADLERADLERANLERAYLERANLERANLERAYLVGAHLRDANLERANLRGAHLQGANLERANLRGAHLYGAYLYGANLEGAYFIDEKGEHPADLRGAQGLSADQLRDPLNRGRLDKRVLMDDELYEELFGEPPPSSDTTRG